MLIPFFQSTDSTKTRSIKNSYYNIYTKKTIELVAEKEKNVIKLKGDEF